MSLFFAGDGGHRADGDRDGGSTAHRRAVADAYALACELCGPGPTAEDAVVAAFREIVHTCELRVENHRPILEATGRHCVASLRRQAAGHDGNRSPGDEGRALSLAVRGGLTVPEIAECLGISAGDVKRRLREALEARRVAPEVRDDGRHD